MLNNKGRNYFLPFSMPSGDHAFEFMKPIESDSTVRVLGE